MDNVMDLQNKTATIQCWVAQYTDTLFQWAWHKTSDKVLAEDLVQDTFLSAVESFHTFQGKSQPKTWLFSILNFKIANHFRKCFKMPEVSWQDELLQHGDDLIESFFDENGHWRMNETLKKDNWQDADLHLLDNPEFATVLNNCMDKLPKHWFSALHLKYLEAKSGEEICQELQISTTNFWQIIHRAKLQLRKCLDVHWFK